MPKIDIENYLNEEENDEITDFWHEENFQQNKKINKIKKDKQYFSQGYQKEKSFKN